MDVSSNVGQFKFSANFELNVIPNRFASHISQHALCQMNQMKVTFKNEFNEYMRKKIHSDNMEKEKKIGRLQGSL